MVAPFFFQIVKGGPIMKTLARIAFVPFFLLAAYLFCGAAQAQIAERNPWCSEGPFNDADKNGVVDGQERGGCNFADQFVANPNGWSVEVASCILEGFLKSPEPSLPGGFSVVQAPDRDFFFSQIWCKGTFVPGIYEIWALNQFTATANGIMISPKLIHLTDVGSLPATLFDHAAPVFEWVLLRTLTYTGGEMGVFIKAEAGQEFGCLFVRIPNGQAPEPGELDCPDVSTNAPISVVVTPQRFAATFVWTFQGGATCTTTVTTGAKKDRYKVGEPISSPIPQKTDC
jgi:hypothetical protein